ncbi:MAG: glycosyltransferase family 2 protein [Candidatus Omnitrophica bacterium]|nr:glycosyltransferase family 2 protein [Candidatus Omnitrophota bacterium]
MSIKNKLKKIAFDILRPIRDCAYLFWFRPRVSVIMSIYNGERFLGQALESIFKQTYRPFEVIVVDDGSSDNSAKVIQSFPRVKYFYQTNSGAGAARNFGISKSRGDFIAFLDQDDLWAPNKLKIQLLYMLKHPQVDYLFAKQLIFIEPEAKLPSALIKRWLNQKDLQKPHTGYLPGTLLARKSTFMKFGYFDPSYKGTSDAEWFFRIKDLGAKMEILPQVLLHKRFHESNHCYQTDVSDREFLRLVESSIKRRLSKG